MKIALADVIAEFDALLDETKTREEVEAFADRFIAESDLGELEMEQGAEDRIWKALNHLSVVALKDAPDQYSYMVEDFVEWRKSIGV